MTVDSGNPLRAGHGRDGALGAVPGDSAEFGTKIIRHEDGILEVVLR